VRRWPWALGGLSLFLLFLLLRLPTAIIGAGLNQACGERCALAQATGTVWTGTARIDWRNADKQWRELGSFAWTWLPEELRNGRLAWRIGFDAGGDATVSLGRDGWKATAAAVRLPVAALSGLLPAAAGRAGWGGELRVNVQFWGCDWSGTRCDGTAQGQWKDAGVAVVSPRRLGDYRLNFRRQPENPKTILFWNTLAGPLWLRVGGEIVDGQFRIGGEGWAEGEDKARLETFLASVGRYDRASGHHRIELAFRAQ
jgi:hypothetical protein